MKFDLLGAASVMPADKYGFKLDPAQMDFGEWINHSTERNYLDCSTLRGEPNPMPKAKTDLLKTKAEIAKALAEWFDYCDATFDKLDDQRILSSPQMVIAFLHTTVHNNEIYGNVVGYLREEHIVPPSTEMMQEIRKGNNTAADVMKAMLEKYTRSSEDAASASGVSTFCAMAGAPPGSARRPPEGERHTRDAWSLLLAADVRHMGHAHDLAVFVHADVTSF